MKDERWLSVVEIAAYLGIKQDTVYKWIKRRELPAHKAGRLWRFRTDEIDNWIRDRNVKKNGKITEE